MIKGSTLAALEGMGVRADPAKSGEHYFAGFPPVQSHSDTAVLKAQEWVHLRDGKDASLAEMVQQSGLERRTFIRRFTAATGMTPIEYCRAVKIARARELLEFGDKPIKQIADELGYADVASFARSFRKRTGETPGAYRAQFGLSGTSSAYAGK